MKASYIPKPLFDDLTQIATLQPPIAVDWAELPKAAASDYHQCCRFLTSYNGNQSTFTAYRRDIERLLHWAWCVAHKSLGELKREDIEAYIYFCQRPRETWIASSNTARFVLQNGAKVPNPTWRPFVASISKKDRRAGKNVVIKEYQLSQSAVQAIFSILSSFFNYLVVEDYVAANPVAQIRQKSKYFRKQQLAAPVRRLSDLQWQYVIETAEKLAALDPAQHERTLFIMSALYGMYLRISELTASERWQPTMGDFYCDTDGNWWFTTVGKGNKQRNISVSDAMLTSLKRYRHSLGMSSLPSPGDNAALIPKFRGNGPVSDTRHIRRIVQTCFDATSTRLHQDGFTQDAELLIAATVHWLRHTGISDDVKHRPREHVRDDAGHGSGAITDRYIDIELRARHASARHKPIKHED